MIFYIQPNSANNVLLYFLLYEPLHGETYHEDSRTTTCSCGGRIYSILI